MIVGFTGTRRGMTDEQAHTVRQYLLAWRPEEVHHGDCVGADEQFHNMAQGEARVVIHPPVEPAYRAHCDGHNTVIRPPRPYLDRNQDIVDASDALLATPKEHSEVLRSGTWATVRRAREAGLDLVIINPKGATQ